MLVVQLIAVFLSLGLANALPADTGRASSVTTVSFRMPCPWHPKVLTNHDIALLSRSPLLGDMVTKSRSTRCRPRMVTSSQCTAYRTRRTLGTMGHALLSSLCTVCCVPPRIGFLLDLTVGWHTCCPKRATMCGWVMPEVTPIPKDTPASRRCCSPSGILSGTISESMICPL